MEIYDGNLGFLHKNTKQGLGNEGDKVKPRAQSEKCGYLRMKRVMAS